MVKHRRTKKYGITDGVSPLSSEFFLSDSSVLSLRSSSCGQNCGGNTHVYAIPMQQCCFRQPKLRLHIYFSLLYLLLVLTLTKFLHSIKKQTNYYQLYKQNLLQFSLKCHQVILEFIGSLYRRSNLVLRTIL